MIVCALIIGKGKSKSLNVYFNISIMLIITTIPKFNCIEAIYEQFFVGSLVSYSLLNHSILSSLFSPSA